MLTLISTLFLSSLLGSLHCVGMCGPFVAFAVGPVNPQAPGRRATLHAAYHGGRLITYSALGAVAGALGAGLDLSGGAFGLQRTAAILAGAMMVFFGGASLLHVYGVRLPPAPAPTLLRKLVMAGNRIALQLTPLRRAATLGLLTTLLPCGWLYAFAFAAAGTASPALGALTMAVFWLGTLPALATFGVGVQALAGSAAKRLPLVTACVLIGVGFYTLSGRVALDPSRIAAATAPPPRPAAVMEPAQVAPHVPAADQTPACCRTHGG